MRKISSENFAFYYKGGMSYATFKTIFPQSIYAKQKDRESSQITSKQINPVWPIDKNRYRKTVR